MKLGEHRTKVGRGPSFFLLVQSLVLPAGQIAAQELGENDFKISETGPVSSLNYPVQWPAVAYNGTDNEYLAVWAGDPIAGAGIEMWEIYGQRIDAETGALVGSPIRISDMGPEGNADFNAIRPAVAYNSVDGEYLVVWAGDDDTGSLVEDEFEIFGQRLDGATGAEIGTNDFRISNLGPDGNAAFDAGAPALAYSSYYDEYLVAWHGDAYEDERISIFLQRLDGATGAEIGTNDMPVGFSGLSRGAYRPAIAYNGLVKQYLVVWMVDVNADAVEVEYEIYGQRIKADSGDLMGDSFRISTMGPHLDPNYDAVDPAVAYNAKMNQYLVVWQGDDDTGGLADEEFEIFGQRLDFLGFPIGADDFRISDTGPLGSTDWGAYSPEIVFDPVQSGFLVLWAADDPSAGLADEEFEIFVQRLDGSGGVPPGDTVHRISDMGPDLAPLYDARWPVAVTYNAKNDEFLAVWAGIERLWSSFFNFWYTDYEIFGQRFAGGWLFADDFESGDTSTWSDTTP